MEDRGWERYGAIAGALGVACFVVGFLLPGGPPKTEDSTSAIAAFFTENRLKVLGEVFLVAFASFLLLVFLAALVSRIRRADGGLGALSLIALLGGVGIVGINMIGATVYGALAFRVALFQLAGPVVRAMYDVGGMCFSLSGFFGALFIGGAALAVNRRSLMPQWLIGLAGIAVILNLVGTVMLFSDHGFFSLDGPFGFVPFVPSMLWILDTSWFLFQPSEPLTAA